MRPVFSSTRQAAAFAALLLVLLAAPLLSRAGFLARRKDTYSSQSIRFERYPWVQQFIFEETNDIDIAFVGSSHLAYDIDTPYVQQELDKRLGRQSVVRSVSWLSGGYDALYFFTRDLLDHRRVKTLVFTDEYSRPNQAAQDYASSWFRYADDDGMLAALPADIRAIYYFGAVVGMPRNLIEVLTPNLPSDPQRNEASYAGWWTSHPENRLGSILTHGCVDPRWEGDHTNFSAFVPKTGATPADLLCYSPETASNFKFLSRPPTVVEAFFGREFVALAKAHGCRLALLHAPNFAERHSLVQMECANCPDLLQEGVSIMALPAPRLFAGLSDWEIGRLYNDPVHFNENGQRYFTRLITPALLDFHENHQTR